MKPGDAGTMTANTSSTIMNMDAVIGRFTPNERSIMSTGSTAKLQINTEDISIATI